MMNREPMQSSLSSVVQVDSFYKSLLDCLVTQVLPKYKMLLGMDVVSAKGGVTIEGNEYDKFKICQGGSFGVVAKVEKIKTCNQI